MQIKSKLTISLQKQADKESLKPQWVALYSIARANFFLSWSWIGNWLNSLNQDFDVIVAKHDHQIVGLGIILRKTNYRNGFIKSTQLHLHRTGDEKLDQTWIEYNDFLLAKGFEKAARKAMVDFITNDASWDEIVIGASDKSAMTPFRLTNLNEHLVWHSHSYQVDLDYLRNANQDYLSTLSKNTRYQINRSMRAYEKRGEIKLERASDSAQALLWFEEATPFHIDRWQKTKVGSGFTNPVFVKFHKDLIKKNYDKGVVDIIKVSAGETIVSYLYNFVQGNEIKFYLSANNYGESDPAFKPGLVAHYLAIKHYIENGASIYDFMAGESQYKRSLASKSSPIFLSVFSKPKLRFTLENKLRAVRDRYFRKTNPAIGVKNSIQVVLTGGTESPVGQEPHYNCAKILQLDISPTGAVKVINQISYTPERSRLSPETNITFKSGSIHANQLSVVTETEVLKYDLTNFDLINNYSLESFNDLHHVITHKGSDFVVNTGLDCVTRVSETNNIEHISALKETALTKYREDLDYRLIKSTKPHLTHPNYAFVLDDKIWVTRCDTMDAICLDDKSLRFNIGQDLVHDGVVFKNSIYFTNVSGQIQVFDIKTRELKLTSDLNHFIPNLSGWCRGIYPISANLVMVGFSKTRSSKKKLGSIKDYGKIILIDILKHQKLYEINTSELGMDAIFSILPGDQK